MLMMKEKKKIILLQMEKNVTNVNSDYHGYYLSGDAAHAYEISGGDPSSILGKQATITGYDVTLTQSGDEEDNLRTRYFVGGYGEFPATEVSGNTVTVNGEKNNWNVVAGGYLTGGYYYAGDVLDTVTVKDNEVIVKSGTVNKVYGGWNNGIWIEESGVAQPLVNGKKKYKRIFIQRVDQRAE